MSAGPVTFETVLAAELAEIQQSRQRRTPEVNITPPASTDPYVAAGDAQLLGVAFSGGGIRSATFNLGILQALSEMDMLRWVDYLSTVSGGGYIGSWLAAWIKRVVPNPPASAVEEVQRRLSPQQSSRFTGEPLNPIHFLRKSSSDVTPRPGFFSTDTWTKIITYLRNLILHQTILVCAISVVLLIPQFAIRPFKSVAFGTRWPIALASLALACPMALIGWNLVRLGANGSAGTPRLYHRHEGIQILVVLPVLAASYLSSLALWQYAGTLEKPPALGDFVGHWQTSVTIFGVLLAFTAVCGTTRRSLKMGKLPAALGLVLLASVLPAAFGGLLLWGLAGFFSYLKSLYGGIWHVLAWGPPLLVAVFLLTVFFHVGLMGLNFPPSSREWWTRLGAWLLIYSLTWSGLVMVAIYSPLLVPYGIKLAAGVGLGWLVSALSPLWSIMRDKTRLEQSLRVFSRVCMLIVYPITTLAFVAWSIQTWWLSSIGENAMGAVPPQLLRGTDLHFGDIIRLQVQIMSSMGGVFLLIALSVLLAATGILAWRVDINEFSMLHFYRDRLVRCYLGASHARRPEAFTGFDPHDDIRLADLAGPSFSGPYLVINATLNLARAEKRPWHERKGASFVFTPKFSGYQVSTRVQASRTAQIAGYRETCHYAYPELGGISLGTAMAISGAPTGHIHGYQSSPMAAFLAAMLNVRLGFWLGNPAGEKYTRSAPKFALVHLIRELFGLTDQRSNFVYLSDAGHFENLGIYELVRRRCRYIIACDADQDADLTFEDLGNAIRKCRTDLGIDIDIDVDSIRRQATGMSRWHCAAGIIRYDMAQRGAVTGTLVYIKSSLTGDEAADVSSYQAQHSAFPHEAAINQWFDESQFESYRKLGYHVAWTTLGAVGQQRPMRNGGESFFVALRQAWYPASTAFVTSFGKHASLLSTLLESLRRDENLRFLDAQFYPEWKSLNARAAPPPPTQFWLPTKPDELRAGFYFCNSLLRVMESVFLDLRLDEEYEHPDNQGWMNLFKHWTWSGMLRATWAVSASTYGARYQTFCRNRLGLDTGEVQVELKGLDAPELNFHERALVDELCRIYPDVCKSASVLVLQMVVSDLSVGAPSRPASAFRFTFGFAVVFQNRFVFFRIQDHLRNTGLGRLALRMVSVRYQFDPTLLRQLSLSTRTERETEVTEELRRMGRDGSPGNFD